MTFLWFITWLFSGTPSFDFTLTDPSAWLIALVVCVVIDVAVAS
jgi:hypothetical protein